MPGFLPDVARGRRGFDLAFSPFGEIALLGDQAVFPQTIEDRAQRRVRVQPGARQAPKPGIGGVVTNKLAIGGRRRQPPAADDRSSRIAAARHLFPNIESGAFPTGAPRKARTPPSTRAVRQKVVPSGSGRRVISICGASAPSSKKFEQRFAVAEITLARARIHHHTLHAIAEQRVMKSGHRFVARLFQCRSAIACVVQAPLKPEGPADPLTTNRQEGTTRDQWQGRRAASPPRPRKK